MTYRKRCGLSFDEKFPFVTVHFFRSVLFLVAFISLLYCSFVFLVFVSALLDRVLDAVLQWRFSSFPVVDLYLLLFSFVSARPGKIASCKNVMKCDVRTYVCMYVCMYVCTAHAPASHSACHDHKKSPAYLLVWVWGSTFAAFGRKGVPL